MGVQTISRGELLVTVVTWECFFLLLVRLEIRLLGATSMVGGATTTSAKRPVTVFAGELVLQLLSASLLVEGATIAPGERPFTVLTGEPFDALG